nr:hypothetical protein [Tanacetum cinerariifolium]
MDIRIPQFNVPSSVINEVITKEMHDGLGREDNTSRSREDSMQLLELMAICTKLSNKVTTLKNELTSTKAVYNKALITLTKRVKNLEKKLKHKRIRMTTWSKVVSKGRHMRQLSIEWILVLLVLKQLMMKLLVKSNDDETLAETLLNIKRSAAKDKGKAIMQESESPKKIKKKEMMKISLDEEIAQRFYEEEKAQILRDEEYAQQIERENFSIEERSRLLAKFIDKRKKMLVSKRVEEKRNKLPTQAQQITYMSNYLKNIGGYTLKQLKQYSFEEIKMLFDNIVDSIRRFVPMESEGQAADSKAEEGSLKAGESLKRSAEEELGQ